MTEPRSHPALSEEQRDPGAGPDDIEQVPADAPDDNPDDLTVGEE